ncbi:MAG: 50S ribosomal protein L20 [Candidatus Pacebacteria bacterium]|nr:50S ribosomal protein L20 [Candidatus Paceibacterota bacterium]
MTRVKRGVMANKRRKKVIKKAKGFLNARSKKYKAAKEALMKAGTYAYRDRKVKKRTMRALWQIRINAKAREFGLSYNRFIHALKLAKIEIDRKILSELAIEDPKIFKNIVEKAKENIK